MEGFGFGSYSETCSPTLGASTYIMRGQGEGVGHTDTTPSCCRIQEELLLPLPAGMGRWTSSSSTTERVTEYGGAARSWRRDQDLLRAFASGKCSSTAATRASSSRLWNLFRGETR